MDLSLRSAQGTNPKVTSPRTRCPILPAPACHLILARPPMKSRLAKDAGSWRDTQSGVCMRVTVVACSPHHRTPGGSAYIYLTHCATPCSMGRDVHSSYVANDSFPKVADSHLQGLLETE